jgi:hypothetical protein
VLERIASDTAATLADIRTDFRDIRADLARLGNRIAALTGITSILGVAVIAILISQGLLWQQLGRIDGRLDGISAQLSEVTTLLRQRTGG